MTQLPKRSDPIYKEIEEFKDYEYTNCIAYEMAIRNKEVIKLKNKLTVAECEHRKNSDLAGWVDYLNVFSFYDKIERDIKNKLKMFGFSERVLNQEVPILLVFKGLKTIPKRELNFVNQNKDDYTIKDIPNGIEKLINFYIEKKELYTMKREEDSSINGKKKYTKALESTTLENVLNGMHYFIPAGDRSLYNGDFIRISSVIPIHWLDVDFLKSLDKQELIPKKIKLFEPRYRRPSLEFFETSVVDISLNLALPREELEAYISKIKDEYDKNNSIIKTPLEILGEVLEKSNNKHTQKKPKAEKYADWFYIYDCYKILKADNKKKSNETIYNEIDLLLLEHYNLIDDDDYYSIETYKKTIMKNMNYLIDELGYKELITGAKNN